MFVPMPNKKPLQLGDVVYTYILEYNPDQLECFPVCFTRDMTVGNKKCYIPNEGLNWTYEKPKDIPHDRWKITQQENNKQYIAVLEETVSPIQKAKLFISYNPPKDKSKMEVLSYDQEDGNQSCDPFPDLTSYVMESTNYCCEEYRSSSIIYDASRSNLRYLGTIAECMKFIKEHENKENASKKAKLDSD